METTLDTFRFFQIRTTLREHKKFRYCIYTLIAALLCIVVVLYLDVAFMTYPGVQPSSSSLVRLSRQVTAEGFPKFSGIYMIRTFLLFFSSALITVSVILLGKYRAADLSRKSHALLEANQVFSAKGQNLALGVLVVITVTFLTVFLVDPAMFNWLCMEDHRIESFSDILQFLNCGLFVYIWLLLGRVKFAHQRLYRSVAAIFAGFFFLCAMEEVSWFQRVLGIETPAAFKGNIQYEMNLHNFATHPLENVYYFFSFAFLIFLPYVKGRTGVFQRSPFLSLFTPDEFILLFSVPFVAYNFGNLNVFDMQLAVGITFFIMLDLLVRRIHQRARFTWTLIIFLIFAISQILFVIFGDHMLRDYDVKEFKEFLIPLSFFVFSVGVLKKLKTHQKTSVDDTVEHFANVS